MIIIIIISCILLYKNVAAYTVGIATMYAGSDSNPLEAALSYTERNVTKF